MDGQEIEAFLGLPFIGRLATCSADQPYVVPVFFEYRDGYVWIPTAAVSKKVDNIKLNKHVALVIDTSDELFLKYDRVTIRGEAELFPEIC